MGNWEMGDGEEIGKEMRREMQARLQGGGGGAQEIEKKKKKSSEQILSYFTYILQLF